MVRVVAVSGAISELPVSTTLANNLLALEEASPGAARTLRDAVPPDSAKLITGRDGVPTFAWTDADGRWSWLGRTSMPGASAPALLDAFQPGMGNALLAPLGQGAEARGLLDRMLPHQAVFVVDERPWAVQLALCLYDFSADFRRGRMQVFLGAEAWEELTAFFLKHRGFLVPERILAWPWSDRQRIHDLTQRLTRLSSEIASSRASLARSDQPGPPTERNTAPSVVILSNIASPAVREHAAELVQAAASLGRPAARFALDDPVMVHPRAIEGALRAAKPTHMILLDTVPAALPYDTAHVPAAILCTHTEPIDAGWLKSVPADALLCVRTDEQAAQVASSGLRAEQIIQLAPACSVRWAERGLVDTGRSVAMVGDFHDVDPQALGLHLGSHQHLWNAAAEIIRQAPDDFFDDRADHVLSAAAKRLGYQLRSQEVRSGLAQRIRRILGPTLVRQSFARAIQQSGIECRYFAYAWHPSPHMTANRNGRRLGEAFESGDVPGLVIFAETDGRVRGECMDILACGIPIAVRAHTRDAQPEGLSALFDPDAHLTRFSTASELVGLVKRFHMNPGPFIAKAQAARRVVLGRHTWAHRLQAIASALRLSGDVPL